MKAPPSKGSINRAYLLLASHCVWEMVESLSMAVKTKCVPRMTTQRNKILRDWNMRINDIVTHKTLQRCGI